jgi:hypothetical protein
MWLSIGMGIAGGIASFFVFNTGTGVGLEWYFEHGEWWLVAIAFAGGVVVFCGLTWLIYLIYARVKRAVKAAVKKELPQDTRPKLLDVRQRIVVWVVASLLSVICIVHGFASAWRGDHWYFPPDSILWIAIFPVILIGAATFLHVMRRKE